MIKGHAESSPAHLQMFSEDDADKRAIQDLTQQAKELRGPMSSLLRNRRDQLKAEVSAERAFALGLKRARKQMTSLLEMASDSYDMRLLQALNDEQLAQFILSGGLGLAMDQLIDLQGTVRQSAERAFESIEPLPMGIGTQLDYIQTQTVAGLFEDVILPDYKAAVRQALRSMALQIPMEIIKSDLNTRLERSEGKQLTEVKTQISEFGRSVTAATAAEAGLNLYLYTGPRDGVTRPFCLELINLVVDESQMSKLNNGQGKSVKISCGGYNCRHSWSPVSESFVEAAELTRATSADINNANDAAKRKKRK